MHTAKAKCRLGRSKVRRSASTRVTWRVRPAAASFSRAMAVNAGLASTPVTWWPAIGQGHQHAPGAAAELQHRIADSLRQAWR